ncbi:MAG: aspartyl protease family protein [Saprospiraceae bacterium]
MIIQLKIGSTIRDFVFDTGASVIFDDDFVSTLDVQDLGKIKTVDSNNKKKYKQYVKMEKINIKNVSFYDIVVGVSDLDALNTATCLNISGIIGANIMNKCIWQIDYENQKIVFTNNRDSLSLSGKEQVINFSSIGKGVPTIPLYADGSYWGEVIIDTGSNKGISINENYLLDSIKFVENHGYSLGLSSTRKSIKKTAIIPSIELNRVFSLKDQAISFDKKRTFGLIGNGFLRNYKMTIDWMNQQIILTENEKILGTFQKDFGFSLLFTDNDIRIGGIRIGSEAYKKGLRLNDVVIGINNIIFNKNIQEKYCEYLESRDNWKEAVVTLRKGNKEVEALIQESDWRELLKKKK